MPSDFALPPDLVTAHAASLRALARSLALDEHAADDVVQETWLRALSSPPARTDGIGGWLRRVVEGFALKRHRSEARRADRERRYSRERPEAVTSSETRAETLREVVEAVLSLEEPYRETVLLRWFEDLPPRDIAARQRTSVATVNSRLQRAHALLRERLSRRLGIDERRLRSVLVAIFGAEAAGKAAAATTVSLVGVSVTTTKSMMVAGAAVLTLCAFLWFGGPDVQPQQPHLAVGAEATELGQAPALAAAALQDERAPLDSATRMAAAAPGALVEVGPYEFDVTILPIDATERPLSQAEVNIGLEGRHLVRLGKAAWNGELRVAWRGFEPSVDLVLEARREGMGASPLRRIHLVAGQPETITIAIDGSAKLLVHLRLEGTSSSTGTRLTETWSTPGGEFTRDAAGNGVFVDPWLLARVEPQPRPQESTLRSRIDEIRSGHLPIGVRFAEPDPFSFTIPSGSHVSAVVTDELLNPLPDVLVTVQAETAAFGSSGRTGHEGKVSMGVPPGPVVVIAGGTGRALARKELQLEPGETQTVALQCPLLPPTRVRLLDAQDQPLAGWHLEVRRKGGDEWLVGRNDTDADGRAELWIPSDFASDLFVRPYGAGTLPKLRLDATSFDRDVETDLILRGHDRPARLTCAVTWTEMRSDLECEVRVWNTRSREGMRMQLVERPRSNDGTAKQALFRADGLVPGEYTIELGAPGVAWKEVGPIFLRSGDDLLAGTFALGESARIELGRGADGSPRRIVRARARSQGLWLEGTAEASGDAQELMSLTPGAWTITAGPADPTKPGLRHGPQQVDAAPGQTVRLDPAESERPR